MLPTQHPKASQYCSRVDESYKMMPPAYQRESDSLGRSSRHPLNRSDSSHTPSLCPKAGSPCPYLANTPPLPLGLRWVSAPTEPSLPAQQSEVSLPWAFPPLPTLQGLPYGAPAILIVCVP